MIAHCESDEHEAPQQLSPAGHASPQPPQFALSVFVSTHCPPHEAFGVTQLVSASTDASTPPSLAAGVELQWTRKHAKRIRAYGIG